MAQLDPIQRGYHQSPRTTKTQASPTFEQLLQDDTPNWPSNTSPSLAKNDASNWSSNVSPMLSKNQDQEECSTPQNKKSVLTKVKEKAKKLKHTLSGRKKNDYADGNNATSWGVNLDDDDDDDDDEEEQEEEEEEIDEDPEYLGAPMYESEMAPESYRENARQNPRANPVVPESHAAPTCVRYENEEEQHIPASANKTITEAVSKRLAPAYAAVSGATSTIASKVASMTIGKPKDQQNNSTPSPAESDTEYSAASDFENSDRSSEFEEKGTNSPQKSDKGISVKEYFMNKLEPGEDERALSQVISKAISPKKSAEDKSMAGKVRAAVTSLLQPEEPSQIQSPTKETYTSTDPSALSSPKLLRQKSVRSTTGTLSSNNPLTNRVSSSPPIPISTNVREAEEDENYGRILQAN